MTGIVIRDVSSLDEYKEVEDLQKEVWQFEERDIVPLTQMVAAKETGGIVAGAFQGDSLVGFVYGFMGREEGTLVIHSHMLAVRPSYRGENLGYQLKLAQREMALALGIKVITWTFDPLQSLNAHLNIEKLGVVGVSYKVNFYGETSSSLHKDIGTDRLWVRWELESNRVQSLLQAKRVPPPEPGTVNRLVRCDEYKMPSRVVVPEKGSSIQTIEIPGDIAAIQEGNPEAAVQWRRVTREAFLSAFEAGFQVTGFCHWEGAQGPIGTYLLTSSPSP